MGGVGEKCSQMDMICKSAEGSLRRDDSAGREQVSVVVVMVMVMVMVMVVVV
jgi:hypothetical protein